MAAGFLIVLQLLEESRCNDGDLLASVYFAVVWELLGRTNTGGERQSVIKILFSMTTLFHASFFTHRRNTQSTP